MLFCVGHWVIACVEGILNEGYTYVVKLLIGGVAIVLPIMIRVPRKHFISCIMSYLVPNTIMDNTTICQKSPETDSNSGGRFSLLTKKKLPLMR